MTNASSATAFATAADMIVRYGVDLLGQLCDDSGSLATAADLQNTGTTAGANLAQLLLDASGELEGRCLRGGRYTAANLNALAGVAKKRLVRLVCRVTMALALERRDPVKPMPAWHEKVEDTLDRLESGEEIFGVQEAMDAGKGMDAITPPDAAPPPRPALSAVANRFFGDRARTYDATSSRPRRSTGWQ